MAGETVLVVGGAGYIGSHTCLDLANKGYKPVVFDNFSNGHREFVKWGPAEEGDIRDRARLDEVLAKHKPSAILHFAALIEVGQSVKDPVAFFELITGGPLDLGYLRAKAQLILDGRLTPASFAVDTAEKDARLIVEAGQDHGVRLDVAAAGAERFRRAGEQGHRDSDMAASYFASWD